MKLAIINGPNLNLLGIRETDIYGNITFLDYLIELKKEFKGIKIAYFQSNVEGEIINELQNCGFDYDGIILNAGAYTHTSVAIADAVKAITVPVIEVHLSNVTKRGEFRHNSYIAPNCKGIILGFGLESYKLAIYFFKNNFGLIKSKGGDNENNY